MHEQSETVGQGPYRNVYGRGTPKAGLPLPPTYRFERSEYPTLDEAEIAAMMRSNLNDFPGWRYSLSDVLRSNPQIRPASTAIDPQSLRTPPNKDYLAALAAYLSFKNNGRPLEDVQPDRSLFTPSPPLTWDASNGMRITHPGGRVDFRQFPKIETLNPHDLKRRSLEQLKTPL